MRLILIGALVLTAGCAGHAPPVVILAPPAVVETSHLWIVPLSTPSSDRICVQTIHLNYRPCWTVGELRIAVVSVKAE
jgi:hypothetical protein